MLSSIIDYSLRHKLIVLLSVVGLIGFGIYAIQHIPIGAVPDITNNQVQVISTSRDLPTEEVERYLTYPVELEMGNLPGVQEIRSISKFGLSVVTIVFDDDMGTYLPRQLISEKLTDIAEQIPEGMGSPSMGPISTGLGEIYQYILDIKPGYEDRYTVTDLRSIQDWIVRRQLSGIPGVVEINTWGGHLKTYEVAVDPMRLQSLDVTLNDVYQAIMANNTVAGGGYIEKDQQSYFIRAEGLVGSIADIESILVKQHGAAPILVRDVARVVYGSATRFGAITGNGEGEKVLGQIMMLKGADAQEVINAVINRVSEIQETLPEGVYINPFLERSELIGKTTWTIAENLILGFLIVLFVVIFLLGQVRSGLVVASVIPLTLLFALSMMYLFGVDANLMSLGAIDFGIIIDGAVIIVEYITFLITQQSHQLSSATRADRRAQMDQLVRTGASKMMHSAVFGQVIIIIVFIPILALTGVEGKMFRPMALTFCFALIGAMILCFTYVPVMAALFLKPSTGGRVSLSSRFVQKAQAIYAPILSKALDYRVAVVTTAIVLFLISVLMFSRMGGEFIPTLDEGDFVIQPVLKTGMSLDATVKMTTRIEKILKRYPEVKQVVSRIGAAEVPTDPMSMEESDVIITLHNKKEWTSASSKDALADVFKRAIMAEIPGIEIEFTQPIEMRFNELISGARADLAIKLFGDDLDLLYSKATQIQDAIQGVEGAADISIEKIDGLPQMSVSYDRAKITQYGVSIDVLNHAVSMGFAGKKAGLVYEGESQYDIVVKYDRAYRGNLDHLRQALVSLPSGEAVPLSAFATIDYSRGPAKISREDTKRRVVIGVNVRGRDLQSVVDEIREQIAAKVTIPPGYYIKYGGQFENLEQATQRLLVAVPIALALILLLLFFAFGNIREALIIYSAIPLAAIGGVLALHVRGMPFSISAGIGFIALFGIAVLNGIVMIEHFKALKTTTMTDTNTLITTGAVDRLRPVLLTALAAALGFLPMAISTSAGAEIQRPLATVVIGGLLTATLLTLIVLPVLYSIWGPSRSTPIGKHTLGLLAVLGLALPATADSQTPVSLHEAISITLANSTTYSTAQLRVDRANALIDGSREVSKTNFFYGWDSNNLTEGATALHILGATHTFKAPSLHRARRDLYGAAVVSEEAQHLLTAAHLAGSVTTLYDHLSYYTALCVVYTSIDSLYDTLVTLTGQQYDLGKKTVLDVLAARQKKNETRSLLQAAQWHTVEIEQALHEVMQHKTPLPISVAKDYQILDLSPQPATRAALEQYNQSMIDRNQKALRATAKEYLPELNLTVFNGIGSADDGAWFPGIQAGVAIPISSSSYAARRIADQLSIEIATQEAQHQTASMDRREQHLHLKLEDLRARLDEHTATVSTTTTALLKAASDAMLAGQIDHLQYLLVLDSARLTSIEHLDLIHAYNQTLITLHYLTIN